MRSLVARLSVVSLVTGLGVAAACSATQEGGNSGSSSSANSSAATNSGGDSASSSSQGGAGQGGFQFGGNNTGGNLPPQCKLPPDGEDGVVPTCDEIAPADSFQPATQWTWTAPPPMDSGAIITGSFITPLVGNFTDDNGDGDIDLCDTPDVIVSAIESFAFGGGALIVTSTATLYALAGDTGAEQFSFDGLVDGFVYPAFGDIDGDMLPELVTADANGNIVAYENDGSLKWTGDAAGYRTSFASAQCTTVAIYDLEGDGDVEILMGWEVFDHEGNLLWGVPNNAAEHDGSYWCVTPTAADLDDDGRLEVLFGHQVYQDDGTLWWTHGNETPGHPHVANLDDDDDPEVFITNQNGISVLDHDGTVKFGPVRPTAPNPGPNCWGKPAVVHDFNGDDIADIAAATCSDYTVYDVGESDVTVRWSNTEVQDFSGLATATAFDFIGDGFAEAIYADETQIYVFDGEQGAVQLTSPRQSGTLIEYPIVADIDNDASAEIVYVSNYADGSTNQTTVTVVRDAEDRWIPARRIWNQYSYHVTNVREDGTIPPVMKKSWLNLNTFRTNAQISAEGDCDPETPR